MNTFRKILIFSSKVIMSNTIETDESSMMPSLLDFFSIKENFQIFKEFVNSRKDRSCKLSLGLLDWFNVNYSKKNKVEYVLKRGNRTKVIYVCQLYNAALSGYTKARFDPFARKGKKEDSVKNKNITICNEEGDSITTTLCQLNYFRWAIKNGIIDYVKEHIEEIYEDLCTRSNRGGKKKIGEKKKKLSVSASKTLGIHDVKMIIKFGLENN